MILTKGIIPFIVILIVIMLIGAIYLTISSQKTSDMPLIKSSSEDSLQEVPQQSPEQEEKKPTLIKHLGVEFGPYDPATNKAGDFKFTRNNLQFNQLFIEYGYLIPSSSAGAAKKNLQPTFILPLGTPVRAPIDGIVIATPIIYSNDYSIQYASSSQKDIIFETEHVINLLVKVGDIVTAGQIVAEVSDYDKHNTLGFGLFELGILQSNSNGEPYHSCPFLYLDQSVKDKINADILKFYEDWNEYKKSTVHSMEGNVIPGCLTIEDIQG